MKEEPMTIEFKTKMLPETKMTVLNFLKLLIGPEFTYCHVLDPRTREELAQGFADDMKGNPIFSQALEVLSFYFSHSSLVINVRRITNE